MNKIASAVLAIAFAVFFASAAFGLKAITNQSSIQIDASSVQKLGGTMIYDVVVPKLTGSEQAVVIENCTQPDATGNQVLVYGTVLGVTNNQATDPLLGGASSPWVSNGGYAECEADLVIQSWKAGVEHRRTLVGISFTASGS